jgi:Tol biopolymer transport system component
MFLGVMMPFSAVGETPVGTQLTFGDEHKFGTEWSPDGKWIAYCAFNEKYCIFIIPSEGGTPLNLTQGIPGHCFSPCFTADSQEVTFSSHGVDGNNDCKIMSINIFTKETRLIMPQEAIPQGINAFWSHNGQYLVYKKFPTAETMVYDKKKDESLSIADGDSTTYGVSCFSPDNETVISTLEGTPYGYSGRQLFSIHRKADKKGTTQRMVNTTGSDPEEYPDYSPDGQWLMYTLGGTPKLYVLKISTGEFMPVFDQDSVVRCSSFSPDCKEFCYLRLTKDVYQLFKKNFVEPGP